MSSPDARRPLSVSEIAERSGLDKPEVRNACETCITEGVLICAKGGKYALPYMLGLKKCTVKAKSGAPAFARASDGGSDIYLDMPYEQAFDGDIVFVRVTQDGEKPRGTLHSIIKRAANRVTGTLYLDAPERGYSRRRKGRRPHYVPENRYLALISDKRYPRQALVKGALPDAEPGDMCVFEVTKWPLKGTEMQVRLEQVLGRESDLGVHLSALCAMHNISEDFSPEALEEAAAYGEDPKRYDIDGRLDLRGETIFTIDGADAQDFDDAVSLERRHDGWTLGVHIADVSHYVKPGSALDAEARERGTSVYLPGRTIPMLPESLCNCLCSLMPHRDRLTFSAIMELDSQGVTQSLQIRPSVIRSCARLTYEDVNEMLAGRANTVPPELHAVLTEMNSLASLLHANRVRHGSLELDMPEVAFSLDETGYPTEIKARERGDAHRLIEEFMLAANRAVASHAEKTELPFPYRVHEKPDSEKLDALEETLAAIGKPMHFGKSPTQSRLQTVLDAFRGKPNGIAVSEMLLRAMSKARYSEKNLGHYGLAFDDYCHFTSPIRRYPDLLAHRMLRLQANTRLTAEDDLRLTASMHTLTDEASENEEEAAQCEREADKLMCAAYMKRNKSKVFAAAVTRFIKKGACVTLENCCEGIIPFRNMDDVYGLDETHVFMMGRSTRRIVRLGDTVYVKCTDADISCGEVEFELLPERKQKRKG